MQVSFDENTIMPFCATFLPKCALDFLTFINSLATCYTSYSQPSKKKGVAHAKLTRTPFKESIVKL
jgi:hypothetical protein